MKTVFSSNYDLAHVYAQRMQHEGRANSMFFEGDKIYSYGYHYELARFIDDKTILINNRGYSSSTGKHIGIVSGATSQYKQFYTMSCDIELVYNQIIELKDKLSKARKPEIYIKDILSLWTSLNEYINYTKKKVKKNTQYKEIKSIVNALNEDSGNYTEKLAELAKKRAKQQKAKERKELKIKLEKFFNYEIDSFRVSNEDYLRISKDGQFIETSQRVKVEINKAAALYKLIKAGKDIKGYTIDYYTVIGLNGVLRIGCHNINRDNMTKIGEQII